MALEIIEDPNKKKADQGAPQAAQGTAPVAPGTSPSSSTAPTVPQSTARQGTGYTNIQKILQASSGAPLAQTVAQGITGAGEKAQQAIGQAQQQFGQASQAGRNIYSPESQQRLQQILATPETAQQEDINFVSGLRTGQYGGPQGLANAAALQQQAAQAQALGKLAGSEAGRAGLLQQFVGGPGYASGQQKLDQLLLGLQGRGQLTQARQAVTGLPGSEQAAEQQAAQQAQQYGQEAGATRSAVTGALGQAESGLESTVGQRAQQTQAQRQADYNQVVSDLQSGKITPQEAQLLGIKAGQQLYNVDPTKFLSQGAQANVYNVATAPEYARAQALAQMAGLTNTFLPGEAKGQIGTLGAAYGLNAPALQQAVQQAQQSYQQQLGGLASKVSAINQLGSTGNQYAFTPVGGPVKQTPEQQIAALRSMIPEWNRQAGNYEGNKLNDEQKAARKQAAQQAQELVNQYDALQQQYTPTRTLTGYGPMQS